jgi:SAM-dependent methyltransferase
MAEDIHKELHEDLCTASPARLDCTRRAFKMLPELDRPRILDIGCGKGEPTIELARLSNGEVIGLDIDQQSLEELSKRIAELGLSDRVRAVRRSMQEMDFEAESFDIIWAEASAHIIGFETALDGWRKYLRPDGYMVIHEMTWLRPDPPSEIANHWRRRYPGIRTVSQYIAAIPHHGYDLIGHFALPDDFWWLHYYGPLEERIRHLRERYENDQRSLGILNREQREVDLYKKYSSWYGSVFLTMRKGIVNLR